MVGCIFVSIDLRYCNWQGKHEEGHLYSSTADGLLKALHSFPDSLSIRYIFWIEMFFLRNYNLVFGIISL